MFLKEGTRDNAKVEITSIKTEHFPGNTLELVHFGSEFNYLLIMEFGKNLFYTHPDSTEGNGMVLCGG